MRISPASTDRGCNMADTRRASSSTRPAKAGGRAPSMPFSESEGGRGLAAGPEEGLDLGKQARKVDGFRFVVVAAGGEGLLAVADHRVRREGDDRDRSGALLPLQAPG